MSNIFSIYLHKDYLKKLYNAITTTNSDISICGFQRVNYDTKKIISTEMCKKESCVDLTNNYGALLEVNTSFWNKMYKREIIMNMLNFQLDSLGLGDMTIHAFLYSNVKKIAFVNDVLYYYQIRSNSNINVMKTEAVDSIYDNLKRIKEYYVKNNKEMCSFLDAYVFLHLGISLIYRFI